MIVENGPPDSLKPQTRFFQVHQQVPAQNAKAESPGVKRQPVDHGLLESVRADAILIGFLGSIAIGYLRHDLGKPQKGVSFLC